MSWLGWSAFVALNPRYRPQWRQRLGLVVPPVSPGALWVHASSLGELRSVEAVLPSLPGPVLITAETDTGFARARVLADGKRVVAGVLPVDHPWAFSPLWAEARPRALVFVESVWWPRLAEHARTQGVPVLRISARVSPATQRVPAWLYRRFTRATTLVSATDEHSAAFFRGRTTAPVVVCGDLKGEAPIPEAPLRFAGPYLVAASTRPGDEERIWRARPRGHALLVAPRHPGRFDEVSAWFAARARTERRSRLVDGHVPQDTEVVVLDSLGELAGCFSGAAAAFIGGTFDPHIGGHSAAEAARAGVPVVAGPEIHANRPSFEHATLCSEEGLARAVATAIQGPRPPAWSSGAVERTCAAMSPWLDNAAAPEVSPRPWARPAVRPLQWRDRRLCQGKTPARLNAWVVAVGSLNARGGGKTTAARWMARALWERGETVGVVVRGYGASGGDLGDEGQLFARDGRLVAAGKWLPSARTLVDRGATALVFDDGLRQLDVHCDFRLEVVDARYPQARGPLPAGEGRPRRFPSDGVIVQHGRGPGPKCRRVQGAWQLGHTTRPLPPGPVAAFCGIARAADFFSSVEAPLAKTRVLRDHQPLDDALIASLMAWAGDLPLVCTAKDWVRLCAPHDARIWWRDVVLEVEDPPPSWFPVRIS